MKVIFVSGPYRADTKEGREANIQKAKDAAIRLWQQGWVAFCPHLNTAHFDGLCPDEVWLKGDLEMLRRCDAIYILKDWKQSEGSQAEVRLAYKLGLEVYFE